MSPRLRRRRADPLAERVLLGIAAGRIAIGIAGLAAPRPVLRALGFDSSDPGGVTLSRMTGARDLGLAAITLSARRDADALRRAALAAGAADSVDCAGFAVAAARGETNAAAGALSALAGAGAAAVSAWAATRL